MIGMQDFPLIVSSLDDRGLKTLKASIELLHDAIENDGLIKSRFQELKDGLNRVFDNAWENAFKKNFNYNRNYAFSDVERDLFICRSIALHMIEGFQKKVLKATISPDIAAVVPVLIAEFVAIAKVVNPLKDKIIVRVAKIEEERRPRYLAPFASRAAAKAISDVLVAVAEEQFDALKAEVALSLNYRIERFLKAKANTPQTAEEYCTIKTRGRCKTDSMLLMWLEKTVTNCLRKYVLSERKPDADAIVETEAFRVATDMRNKFLIKTMSKLDSIVETKGDFDKIEVLPNTMSRDFMQNALRVSFKDGSSFIARNSIVYSHSVLGLEFARYPLTFHDVVIRGQNMQEPSEQRMNEVFALPSPMLASA